jgi:hypothetical protein
MQNDFVTGLLMLAPHVSLRFGDVVSNCGILCCISVGLRIGLGSSLCVSSAGCIVVGLGSSVYISSAGCLVVAACILSSFCVC